MTRDGRPVTVADARVAAGETYVIALPAAAAAADSPQPIPLAIAYEDADLIVVDKPAGMVVHPAPGARDGTLVNALLAHCGPALSGVGWTTARITGWRASSRPTASNAATSRSSMVCPIPPTRACAGSGA